MNIPEPRGRITCGCAVCDGDIRLGPGWWQFACWFQYPEGQELLCRGCAEWAEAAFCEVTGRIFPTGAWL